MIKSLKIKAIREDYFTVWIVGYDSDGEFCVVGEYASEWEAVAEMERYKREDKFGTP